ncbi:MAG: UvrD-helicase domain-containing protein [Oligoflexales bacterium]|nr:UvrD-helicase domain-containing protein [Oligoflexales bacterium]
MTREPASSAFRNLDEILPLLNKPQQEAVTFGEGPLLIFAGAGSGKTLVITTRIAALIEKGVRPQSILAVTFTNKAAKEMRIRLGQLSPLAQLVHLGTFHSVCVRWLREFSPEIGFSSDFSIYDEQDVSTALKLLLKEIGFDKDVSADTYRQAISRAKTYGWLPAEAAAQPQSEPRMWAEVYKRYQETLARSNAMDFDDLLMNMLLLLRKNQLVRQKLQNRYRYILVDEYQDTNPTQFALISHLVSDTKSLCVVGDDDQSIYSWRGADPSNILDFQKHYPGAHIVRLEQNYRSTGNVIQAASGLIIHNKQRAEKTLWTAEDSGDLIDFHIDMDGELEAHTVVDQIIREKNRYAYDKVSILYRTNAQSRIFEDALRRKKIPYRLYGALRFYDRLEVRDLLAYFRLISNRHDNIAFRRILNVPSRGLGKKAMSSLEEKSISIDGSLLEAMKVLAHPGRGSNGKLADLLTLLEDLKEKAAKSSLADLLPYLVQRLDYLSYLEKKFPDNFRERVGNVYELGSALAEYAEQNPEASLDQWLNDAALTGSENEEEGGVCLMTLHSAKGLEFERVYIVGLEEGLIPHSHSQDQLENLEEERRLLYVGITRARAKLSLSAARIRRVYNTVTANKPSRFLKELPLDCFDKTSQKLLGRRTVLTTEESFDATSSDLQGLRKSLRKIGDLVRHPSYGKGLIELIEEEYGVEKAVVRFVDFGLRKVSLEHLDS